MSLDAGKDRSAPDVSGAAFSNLRRAKSLDRRVTESSMTVSVSADNAHMLIPLFFQTNNGNEWGDKISCSAEPRRSEFLSVVLSTDSSDREAKWCKVCWDPAPGLIRSACGWSVWLTSSCQHPTPTYTHTHTRKAMRTPLPPPPVMIINS